MEGVITAWEDLPQRGELVYKDGLYYRVREVAVSHADGGRNQYNIFEPTVEAMTYRILAEILPDEEQEAVKKA